MKYDFLVACYINNDYTLQRPHAFSDHQFVVPILVFITFWLEKLLM